VAVASTSPAEAPPEMATQSTNTDGDDRMLSEVATCLWYLKTKHFRQSWDTEDRSDDDPKVRRALGRVNNCLAVLKAGNIEIQDPTNKRYPPGIGYLMKPVQLQPTPGITVEKVVETVKPIVFRNGRLIQQGEVFVAVPEENSQPADASATDSAPSTAAHVSPPEDGPPTSLLQIDQSTQPTSNRDDSQLPPPAPAAPLV